MKVKFDPQRITDTFNADAEFRLSARFWDGTLEFGVGDQVYLIEMSDGQVAGVEISDALTFTEKDAEAGSRRVRISGPHADWAEMVKTPAPPFYLDYYSASAHHDFTLGGDPESLWAYYPAIRRTTDLFRQIAILEEGN